MGKIVSLSGLPAVGKTTAIQLLKLLRPDWHFYSTELEDDKKKAIQNLHRADKLNYNLIQDIYFENLFFHAGVMDRLFDSSSMLVVDRGFEDCLAVSTYFSQKGLLLNLDGYIEKFKCLKRYASDLVIFLFAEIDQIVSRQTSRDIDLGKNKRPVDDSFIGEISEFYFQWYKTNTVSAFINTTIMTPNLVADKIATTIETKVW